MDRMPSIFPVFQLACVLLDACFSKKEEKKKKEVPVKFYDVVSEQLLCFERVSCVLQSSRTMGKEEGGQGKVVPFGVGPAQRRDAPVLVPLARIRSWGHMLSFLVPQNKGSPLFI